MSRTHARWLGTNAVILLAFVTLIGWWGYRMWFEREVLSLRFVVQSGNEWREASEVPLVEGTGYGWVMRLRGDREVHWREEFVLPDAPKEWGAGQISGDRRVAVSHGDWRPSDGEPVVTNYWAVAAGDPAGTYVMRVYVNEELVRALVFTVRPTP